MFLNKYYHKLSRLKSDLHVHTRISDGAYTPYELVKLASERGISVLAITDHDTVAGIEEAKTAAEIFGIELISGVELSTILDDKEIHILGYQFDLKYPRLVDTLQTLSEARDRRAQKIISRLNELGYGVTMEDVREQAGSELIGRPHIALALIKHGYIHSIEEGFAKFLSPGGLAYVPRYRIQPQEAIKLIIEAGGLPILAHPGLSFPSQLLPEFVQWGLAGIEVYHPDNSLQIRDYYQRRADEEGLLVTGGSDFHGHEQTDFENLGQMPTKAETLAQILSRKT